LGVATLSIISNNKRRVERVEIHAVLDNLLKLLTPFSDGRTTTVLREYGQGSPFLRTSVAALESVFANLINNSLAAFERAGTEDRRIRIKTTVRETKILVAIADSGPGIIDLGVDDIWLPGISASPDGTGLGLTIVKDTLRDLGGSIAVEAAGALGGAEFMVEIPILGT
jgi:C4-dicarboxylate-specific signal transduction histidine kinase